MFIDAKLQTAMLSLFCGRQISVHKLDMWIVPVLLFRARKFMESFQTSHGCEVVCKATKMARYCSVAGTFLKILNFPSSAICTYSLYLFENSWPYNSFKSGTSFGSNIYQSALASTLFINSSDK